MGRWIWVRVFRSHSECDVWEGTEAPLKARGDYVYLVDKRQGSRLKVMAVCQPSDKKNLTPLGAHYMLRHISAGWTLPPGPPGTL
jgi:hypothetical protein